MTDLWYLNTKKITKQELEGSLNLFPINMVNEIMRFRNHEDRVHKLFGKLIIKKYYADLGHAFNWSAWKIASNGKPFYDVNKNFNISHSGDYVVVAFSEQQIGVDIEKITEFDVKSISTLFHPKEVEYIQHSTDLKSAFFKLWTRKESYLKATGRGIVNGLHHENCLPGKLKDQYTWHLYSLSLIYNYQLAICIQGPEAMINTRELFQNELKN